MNSNCPHCQGIFKDFIACDIRIPEIVLPQNQRGVYAVRIKEYGRIEDVLQTIERIETKLNEIDWQLLTRRIKPRLARLKPIGRLCDIIYIGGAGIRVGQMGGLDQRHDHLVTGHTAMYLFWILLYHDFKLEYGYQTSNPNTEIETSNMENFVKSQYKNCHNNSLPILTDR